MGATRLQLWQDVGGQLKVAGAGVDRAAGAMGQEGGQREAASGLSSRGRPALKAGEEEV